MKKLSIILKYAVIVLFAIISLFPIYIMLATSLKTNNQIFSTPPLWFFKPILENYKNVLIEKDFLKYFTNSIIITLTCTLFSTSLGALAGYALARFKFMGRRVVHISVLFLRMVPPVILVIPLFILWSRFGLIDGRLGLSLAYVALNLPFNIWVMRIFINQIPIELEEAAYIDGCNEWSVFFRIIFPLTAPGLAVASIFTFRIALNEFIIAFVLTNRFSRTLPVAVSLYLTEMGIRWGEITAIATIIALPAFIFTFVAAKHLIMGMTAGALKG